MTPLLMLVLLGAVALPWIGLSHALLRPPRCAEDWIDGICLGFGIAVGLLYLCALSALSWVPGVWLTGLLVSAGLRLTTRRRHPRSRRRWGWEAHSLGLLFVLYLTIRALPLFVQEYPLGWDPYFHLVLADKVMRVGRVIADWSPFEPIALNYPLGSHLLLALLAGVGHVPVHTVFTLAVIAFTALTGLQVFALVSRAANSPEIGLYASAAYWFLATYGSLRYALWGALPNVIAMYLCVGLLSWLHRDELSDRRMAIVFAILFLAIALVHHHSMLAAAWVLVWRRLDCRWIHPDPAQARRLGLGLTLSALLGAPYFLGYLLKIPTLRATSIAGYVEAVQWPHTLMPEFGEAFFISMLCGLLLYRSGTTPHQLSRGLLQAILSLLAVFVLLQYLCRAVSLAWLGRVVAPFTPTHFLNDCVALLTVFPALFVWQLKTWCGRRPRWAVGMVLAGFLLNWPVYRDTFRRDPPEANVEAYQWLRAHAAADALILDPAIQASYLTQRSSSHMPLPTSEYGKRATNAQLAEQIRRGAVPPDAPRRQILVVTRDPAPPLGGRVRWSHPSGLRILEPGPPDAEWPADLAPPRRAGRPHHGSRAARLPAPRRRPVSGDHEPMRRGRYSTVESGYTQVSYRHDGSRSTRLILVWRRAMVLMLWWLMTMGVAGVEAATLPPDDLQIHLDASDPGNLWKTYAASGAHSGTPADGEAVQVWDDEGDGMANIAFVYITEAARSPIYRSASSPMRHACVDFDGRDDSLKAVTQNGMVGHPSSDFITASAFTLLMAFHPHSIPDPDESDKNMSVIGDGQAFWGIYLGTVSGQQVVISYNWDSNADGVLFEIHENETSVLMYRHEDGHLFASLNGGAEVSVASGVTTQLTSLLHIGKTDPGSYYDGCIGELAIYDAALAGTALQNAIQYFTDKWLSSSGK